MNFIDLRSDTVTELTENMRKAMYTAIVGDDVYDDDETTKQLEAYAAELIGMEAALFVPSGTFGNQLSLLTHCNHGEEVILGDNCHIVADEVGASSIIAGVQLRTISTQNGEINPLDIENRIRVGDDIHYPKTALICLENAHSNGRVISLENMNEIREISKRHNIPIHLDGARLFNAASYLGVDVKEITKNVDSVMFCLSKGLCAPVGSILAGNKEFIAKAKKYRKLMGGGLRQCGVIAAPALIGLKEMIPNLKVDHEKALLLAKELSSISGITVFEDDIHVNMVFLTLDESIPSNGLVDYLFSKGIKINGAENGTMRFVTHYWITEENIHTVVQSIKDYITSL
ncbi:MAG: low specificity L-threonine aldolase [Clostridium sp.]|uniref:threonine aldolase family protein n=1 Tax=Clostridium sp. TaxID=1506 RepID=UPI00304054E8